MAAVGPPATGGWAAEPSLRSAIAPGDASEEDSDEAGMTGEKADTHPYCEEWRCLLR